MSPRTRNEPCLAPDNQHGAGRVALLANTAWNLAHFREPLIRDLVRRGFSVFAIAPFDGSERKLVEMGAQPINISMERGGLSPWADLMLLRSYRRIFRDVVPDIVLSFTIKPNVWGNLAIGGSQIPVINNVSGLGTAFIDRPLLKWFVSSLYRRAFRRSSRVFFQNAEDVEAFVEAGLVTSAQAALLAGSGVDLGRFAVSSSPPTDTFCFLFVGRLLRDKGLNELAMASRMLKQEGRIFTVRIVGPRDPENRSAIPVGQLEAWEREELLTFVGALDDVRHEIAGCDCLVLPSYREGLPRTVLEASAMGRPIIATDVPGCRQAVQHGVTGLLCRAYDAAELAKAMKEMMDLDRGARVSMGMKGRVFMEQHFSQDRVVELYREAIANVMVAARGAA